MPRLACDAAAGFGGDLRRQPPAVIYSAGISAGGAVPSAYAVPSRHSSPGSIWNKSLPAHAPLDPGSAALVGPFDEGIATEGQATGAHGYFEGKTPQQLLASFPWSHLQLLKMELHRIGSGRRKR